MKREVQKEPVPPRNESFRVAVDIGGTFTDLVYLQEESGKFGFVKTDTVPEDPSAGVMAALKKGNLALDRVPLFIHGTTLGLNALLERKGARTALITTKGFRDVLEIGRLSRPWMYDILYRKPPTLIPRRYRYEVTERLNNRGEVLTPLDENETRNAVRSLLQQGIKVFAVCLLHSYANPAHEVLVGDIIKQEAPDAFVSLSHQILQQFYEYERTVSTVVNASIQPVMDKYLDRLWGDLVKNRFRGEFLVTRSAGGAMNHKEARAMPLQTVLSGPAGGVQGATFLSKALSIPNLIAIDAGGTSFDVSLISNGEPRVRSEATLAGYELLLPIVDMETIGAGGGSIAWVDSGNALQVGPQSAGAIPGPICYGRGGLHPTVTDAVVSLGIIDPQYFLGGALSLDSKAARRGVQERVADPLGISLEQAASGIISITETKMVGAIREMSVARGYDPREFSILSYGGAGSLFAASLAEKVGVPQVIVPRWPGNFSAWGMLMFDIVHDLVQSYVVELSKAPIPKINEIFAEMRKTALAALARQGVPQDNQILFHSADMKYVMAGHFINVSMATGKLDEPDREILKSRFNKQHQTLYGHQLEDVLQIVNFRIRAVGRIPKPTLEHIAVREGKNPAKGTRLIYDHALRKTVEYSILDRDRICPGFTFDGPAIVEEPSSTVVLPASFRLLTDEFGNLILNQKPRDL